MSSAPTQYLAVVFTAEFVSAVLWQHEGGQTTVITQSKAVGVKSWKLHDINQAIDAALDELGEAGLTIKHVLFGVPNSWIEDNALQKDKKHILKTLTQDLLLDPLGYVVNSDALAAGQRNKTGQPFTGAFVSTSQHFLEVERYERGHLVQAEKVGRSGEIAQDAVELLARFPMLKGKERCILTGAHNQEELEALLAEKRGAPLEYLAVDQATKMIVEAGGAETLEAQSAESHKDNTKSAAPENTLTDTPNLAATQTGDDANIDSDFTTPSFLATATGASAESVEAPSLPQTNQHDGPLMNTPRFVVNGAPAAPPEENSLDMEESFESINDDEPETAVPITQTRKFPTFRLPSFSAAPFSTGKKKVVWLGGGAVLLLFIVGAAAFFTLRNSVKATVAVWAKTQTLKEDQSFLVRTESQTPSASQSSILAQSFTETVTLDKEVPTTGSKIIGENAKGKVKIFNRTFQEKTFPAGTKITHDKFTFTLDNEVKVASASSQEYNVIASSEEVSVTASAIGPESNLDKDKEFSIANFDTSSYAAKNAAAFSGGSSREIQAVAKKDIDTATSDLLQAATTQLREQIESQGTQESPVLFGHQVKIASSQSSAKVGDEQKFVTVTLTAEAQGLRVPAQELERVAIEVFESKLEPGQQLQPGKTRISTKSLSGDLNNLQLQAELSTQILPDISASELRQKVAGQYIPRAETLLRESANVARFEIRLSPAWMRPLVRTLPQDEQRLEFTIRLEEES